MDLPKLNVPRLGTPFCRVAPMSALLLASAAGLAGHSLGCGGAVRTAAVADAGIVAAVDAGTAAVADAGIVAVAPPPTGAVLACPEGYAHANICCAPAPFASTDCLEAQAQPFQPCETGWITIPDPQRCCALNAPGLCVSPSQADSGAPAGSGCYFPCGAGGYLPSNLPLDASAGLPDCADVSAGGCVYCCKDEGASVCVVNMPPITCPDCPVSWEVPEGGQFDVCCTQPNSSSSARECFSSADAIVSPPPVQPGQ